MSEGEANRTNNKRKRKKGFLKNARKYAKKGCFGRGNQLDPFTYQNFVKVLEIFQQGFDSDEDRSIYVDKALKETNGLEVDCSCNQVGCRAVETLLPYASSEALGRFIDVLGEKLRPLCADRFATHVLEALLRRACTVSLSNTQNEEDFRTKCKDFVLKLSKFLLNNLEDYVWDNYGNHVIRTCIENLAQIPKETQNCLTKSVETGIKEEPVSLPPEYLEVVTEYAERILRWPQFNELCSQEITSGFLQVLLRALKQTAPKLLKKYTKKLLEDIFAPESQETLDSEVPAVFLSTSTIMLLEACIRVASKKHFTQIYAKLFVGRLPKLAVLRSTNFAVQNVIAHCKEKVEFEAIVEELKDSFKDIVSAGNTGVLLALAQGCKRFSTHQGLFVQSIIKALNCEDSQKALVLCLAKFADYDQIKDQEHDLQKAKLSLHGTLILQTILEFNKPIKVVNSILNMEPVMLKDLFSNTMGSHIVDSYVNSEFVGEKSREKLIKRLRGFYHQLAGSKFGSRSFEALWKVASLQNKISIMEELTHKEGLWLHKDFGKIIANKVKLPLYKNNLENWKSSISKDRNKGEKLADKTTKRE